MNWKRANGYQIMGQKKPKYTVPQWFIDACKEINKVVCPVCGFKDVIEDIGAHGPGVSIMHYSCGCQVRDIDDQPTEYIKGH